MKLWLLPFFLASYAVAQTPAAQAPVSVNQATAACGAEQVKFGVVLDNSEHAAEPAEPGMARVIFVQDLGMEGPFGTGMAQVTKIGMDGAWVGAAKDNSWLSVSVVPGVHHICVRPQVRFFGKVFELAHFNAVAGRDYYFRIRNFMWQTQRVELGRVDEDQARYMIAAYPRSVASKK